ncbi:unnamed protein product [Paramecium sonneborni]|uniref:MORN repeat protein n=1 Tax=Paramecium sonneborni TaxID=65129 RepID=A0A8S1RLJ5_9CILI|nr:unnamed protein product [Paramecium sonneborni]
MLVNILVGKTLDDWNSQKNTNLQKLQQVQTWLESEVKNFSTKLTAQITQINSIIKNQNQEQYVWKEGTQEHIGIIWDYEYDPPRSKKTKFQITFTKNKQILYMRDGQILRTEQFKDISKKPEVLTNLEQIQNLQWVGEYGKNKFKVGNWKAIWIEQTLKDVAGLYSIEGKKQGLWKDIIKNFWSQAQAFEIGEYTNDQRKGIWKQIYMDKELGSGEYNNQGEKYGKWIELSEGFNQHSQVLYNGEYKNGKKVGRWEIFYKGKYEKKFTKIGGGSYDEGGSNKIGFWMKKLFIGGGSQDEGSIKIGRWVELSEEFYDDSQVTNNGEYKNGKKVGMWDIVAWGRKIGGGSYTEGDSTKIGSWIELSEGFKYNSQVTYKGEYKCGRKTGRWDLIFNGKLIGGGLYKEVEGDSIKVGNWIEMNDQFWENFQVIYTGEYNKIGQKVGKWVEIDLEINKQLKEIKYDN